MMTIVHRLIWQDYTIELRHVSNWHDCRIDHLEIKTVSPQGAALPITETGYKSHFVDESHLIERGGAVAYVRAWLDEASRSSQWQADVQARRQGSLF